MDEKSRKTSLKVMMIGLVAASLVVVGLAATIVGATNLRRGMEDEVETGVMAACISYAQVLNYTREHLHSTTAAALFSGSKMPMSILLLSPSTPSVLRAHSTTILSAGTLRQTIRKRIVFCLTYSSGFAWTYFLRNGSYTFPSFCFT